VVTKGNVDQFRNSFQEEAREIVVELEAALLLLNENREDAELVGRVFRALHTIKGSGAMFGFDKLAGFTHNLETAFDEVRNGRFKINSELIDLTLSALDQIRGMIEDGNGGAHPGVNVAFDLEDFGDLHGIDVEDVALGLGLIERGVLFGQGVDVVIGGIVVLDVDLLADLDGQHVGRILAAALIDDGGGQCAGVAGGERESFVGLDVNDDVGEIALVVGDDGFIGGRVGVLIVAGLDSAHVDGLGIGDFAGDFDVTGDLPETQGAGSGPEGGGEQKAPEFHRLLLKKKNPVNLQGDILVTLGSRCKPGGTDGQRHPVTTRNRRKH